MICNWPALVTSVTEEWMPTEATLNIARLLRQQVESWQTAGVTHLTVPNSALVDSRVDSAAAVVVTAAPSASPSPIHPPAPSIATPALLPMKAPPLSKVAPVKTLFAGSNEASTVEATPASSASSLSRDDRIQRLAVLTEAVRSCTRCTELAETRTQTVFGVGNPEARILFIGEAPGADEDAQGEPFVGKAGQLLNQIIAACRLKREEIYICNVLKCRPPGNRTPLPDECVHCREYLDGQLATVAPEYIVCWGAVAAQNLLKTDVAIGKLRKRFHQHGRAKVLCTYHPSYLLRNPAAKKDVWDDMKLLFADMGVDLSQK